MIIFITAGLVCWAGGIVAHVVCSTKQTVVAVQEEEKAKEMDKKEGEKKKGEKSEKKSNKKNKEKNKKNNNKKKKKQKEKEKEGEPKDGGFQASHSDSSKANQAIPASVASRSGGGFASIPFPPSSAKHGLPLSSGQNMVFMSNVAQSTTAQSAFGQGFALSVTPSTAAQNVFRQGFAQSVAPSTSAQNVFGQGFASSVALSVANAQATPMPSAAGRDVFFKTCQARWVLGDKARDLLSLDHTLPLSLSLSPSVSFSPPPAPRLSLL